MNDYYRLPSPNRGTSRDPTDARQRDLERREQSWKDFSGSPGIQDLRDNSMDRDRDMRRHGNMGYDQRNNNYQRGEQGQLGRPAQELDYHSMYDDGQFSDQKSRSDDRDRGRRRYYRDRDDPRFRSLSRSRSRSPHARSRGYSHDARDRTRSRSRSPRMAGRPTDTVMIEGLPQDASPSELHACIMNDTIASEFTSINVRLSSSNGSRRAFVQFQNIDYAARFVRHHYPEVRLDSLQGVGDSAGPPRGHYIHYARSREEEKDSWECVKCRFSNYGTRTRCKDCGTPQPSGSEWKQNFTGATDAADAAQASSQILVVYPLGSFINENMLAEELKRLEIEKPVATRDTTAGAPKLKSTAPTGDTTGLGARQGSLHRIFLMRDVQSHESFKYGFVEFWTLEDAQAALNKFHKSKVFTVSGCVVNVAMIHMGVFLPEEREQHPGQQHMSFVPLFNPSIRVRYRDMRLYPSERMISPIPPAALDMSRKVNDEAEKKAKKRKAESASGAGAAKKKPAPGGMMGQMAMWQRKHEELHVPEEELEPHKPGRPDRPQISDANSVPVRANPNAPIRFNIGQQKPGAPPPPSDPAPTPPPLAEPATSAEGEGSKRADSSSAEEQPLSFVDRGRLRCLICMRQYKSIDEVNQHERSANHKTATENEELVELAMPRLASRDKRIAKEKQENPPDEDAGDKPQYRDRAKERRQANNQPNAAPSQKPQQQQQQQQRRQSPSEKEQPAAPAKPAAPSKGAGMLAKMGWTSGSGLGANGEGRTEVVPTEAYQEGVGLGAEGGKLGDAAEVAERRTKGGYAEYVSSVQDRARERYNQL